MAKILIVLPTYNEELVIKENTLKVFKFCQEKFKNYDWQILIADNGSTDGTLRIAEELSKNVCGTRPPTNYPAPATATKRDPAEAVTGPRFGGGELNTNIQITNRILFFHIPDKGRGYALKKAWSNEYPADLYAYMDADLSSDLNAFPLLVESIENGYQLATGSRLKTGHQTERSLAREILSRGYNLLLRILFKPTFQDAQCGFKIITKEVAQKILPKIKNNNWFFDTELFILAENAGFKIKEVPIEWLETRAHNENYGLGRAHKQGLCALERQVKRKSTVKILSTVWEDIKGMMGLSQRLRNS